MGRPAKDGSRRYVRLPDTLWERIDFLAASHDTDYSKVIEVGYTIGQEDPRFQDRLNEGGNSLFWEKLQVLPHLDTLRAVISTGGTLDAKMFNDHSTSLLTALISAYKTWETLAETLEITLDNWLVSHLFPKASPELLQAAAREDIIIDKENRIWYLRILRASKKLTGEINSLVEQKKLLPRNDLNAGRYEINLD